ncbi:glycosyltransferase family 4 protein [Trichothermofontia sichuanensis B231]|uniref:glycosyltransferase family 4 protein n=1 Tax=Trichothermofontia sichuanensis TaxID=3045816 RepID=UPI002247C506|nr:glycosyltransferase family 4 protein [Trichothermofontia sichuanensis]UZQ55320.1 glycosyltransferase family 4 protein [Trichothermofontia sichuanensis B231]
MKSFTKILIISHQYYPIIGGVPVVAHLLSQALADLGYLVKLVTNTPNSNSEFNVKSNGFTVYRQIGIFSLLCQYLWAEAILMIGPSVRSGWPAFLLNKQLLISHQAGVPQGWLQRQLTSRAINVACSQYLAKEVGFNCIGISNPFDSSLFRTDQPDLAQKDREWVFVGRLIPQKGVDIFLKAIAILNDKGIHSQGTVIGDGDSVESLKELSTTLNINFLIDFTGPLVGESLRAMLRRHKFGVIPSIGAEPFGIVALELIACGCIVLASNVGGLPEAVGKCGLLFESGNPQALAELMLTIRNDPDLQRRLKQEANEHLIKSTPEYVAKAYLKTLYLNL